MPERTLYYWSKMYSTQIKSGDTYDKLKKCITINIVDFKCIELKKLHTVYHLVEEKTKYKLTDLIEIHFLELSKLEDEEVPKDENDPIVIWMKFLNAKSKNEPIEKIMKYTKLTIEKIEEIRNQ